MVCNFYLVDSFVFLLQDRDKLQRQHLADTVEELKRYNARRKLKGAVQAIAGGIAMDPLFGTDTDSSKLKQGMTGSRLPFSSRFFFSKSGDFMEMLSFDRKNIEN